MRRPTAPSGAPVVARVSPRTPPGPRPDGSRGIEADRGKSDPPWTPGGDFALCVTANEGPPVMRHGAMRRQDQCAARSIQGALRAGRQGGGDVLDGGAWPPRSSTAMAPRASSRSMATSAFDRLAPALRSPTKRQPPPPRCPLGLSGKNFLKRKYLEFF